MRAKERTSSCTWEWPGRDGPVLPVRCHAAARSRPFAGRWPGGASGPLLPGMQRAVKGRGGPQNSSRRPTRPLVGSALLLQARPLPSQAPRRLQMLKNVRFGPCSSSSGSHPASWLWPPPGSGRASAWSCSPPPPSTSPWPPTWRRRRLGRRRPRPGAGGAPALGRGLHRRAGRHRPGGHPSWGDLKYRHRAAPAGLVRVRGAVRRPPVVGERAEPGPAGHPPRGDPGPAGQRCHPRPDPLVPAGGGRRRGRRGRGRPAVLAPPRLLRRGHVGQPDPDGGGAGPRLPRLPAGQPS